MYAIAIYLYMLCVNVAALFGNKKARLLVRGHRQTWRTLRDKVAPGESYVWFHAASLGEFEQGRPLMERLRREQPRRRILLTFFSPSGYEVRKDYPVADIICYLPFDTRRNARRFLSLVRIEQAFLIKYEFWRNYIETLHAANVPIYSVSSIFREGQIFFRPYGRSYARVLKDVTRFFVQNEASRHLLARLGVERVDVVGDTRFARVVQIRDEAKPLPLVEAFEQGHKVLVAGSTWPPDEDLLIHYFNRHTELRLVLAPHVVSEEHVAQLLSKLKRPALRYTRATAEAAREADCLIIDCYRLLASVYRYATVAYVGGGFGVGIHNVPEAAVYGVPVIIGPNNRKFREARALLQRGACFEVTDQDSFDAVLDRLLIDTDALAHAGDAARAYIEENAGAADKIYDATLRPASAETDTEAEPPAAAPNLPQHPDGLD